MKKLLLFCGIFTILFSSCSSDDSTSDVPVKLVKKVHQTFGNSNKSYTNEFSYDGRKIVNQIVKENDKYVQTISYHYTGDLISSFEIKNGTEFISSVSFTYEGNKLKTWLEKNKVVDTDQFYYRKGIYTYNTDGTISFFQNDLDINTQEESNLVSGLLTLVNGNVFKLTHSVIFLEITTKAEFEYDSKNSPYKNILGVHSLLNLGGFGYSENNMTKTTITDHYEPYDIHTYSTSFTYDHTNFPIESKSTIDNVVVTTQFFY